MPICNRKISMQKNISPPLSKSLYKITLLSIWKRNAIFYRITKSSFNLVYLHIQLNLKITVQASQHLLFFPAVTLHYPTQKTRIKIPNPIRTSQPLPVLSSIPYQPFPSLFSNKLRILKKTIQHTGYATLRYNISSDYRKRMERGCSS